MPTFYSEPIEALFDEPPMLEKKPGCPNDFSWRDRTYHVVETLREWHDYMPRGATRDRAEREHGRFWVQAAQQRRGSWGVGRDYYRVRTDSGELFDIYYDRKGGKGGWYLWRSVDESAADDPAGGDGQGDPARRD